MIKHLLFEPFPFLTSPYLQTIIAGFSSAGPTPPTQSLVVNLKDGDLLSCQESTPINWAPFHKTILLLHGLSGSHQSNYMVRLSRKCYQSGWKVIRMNMRGCGSGKGLAKNPYHAGRSQDLLELVHLLKKNHPDSPIILVGFSLGGNLILKLMGELADKALLLIDKAIAVCPSIDLHESCLRLQWPQNKLFHNYFLAKCHQFAEPWIGDKKYSSLYEFDNFATAPFSGFKDALDYYNQSSSKYFFSSIQHPCHILFAKDDPIINYQTALAQPFNPFIHISLCNQGGHMGFLGKKEFFWLDKLILQWIQKS